MTASVSPTPACARARSRGKSCARGFSRRPVQRRGAGADRALAGLAVAGHGAASVRRAPAKAISRRSGRPMSARARSRPRALARLDLPVALATGALVLENLDSAGLDERALFHLLNLAREEAAYRADHRARRARRAGGRHPRSRVAAARAAGGGAGAAGRRAAARGHRQAGSDRQLTVDEGLVGYLANRIERSFAAARAAVARLDEEALRLHRPVTQSLAGELFRPASA